MSSVECLREFVNERLIAAAEEIFGVFQETIVEYEEEIYRQSKLLDIVWKPEIKLHRIDLQQQHVCEETEEEVLTDQQLCNQERSSSLDQEDPEPLQIKEEQEELCTSQEGEEVVLKVEAVTCMVTPTDEEKDHVKPEPENNQSEPEPENAEQQHKGRSCSNTHKQSFECDICNKDFKYKSVLQTHMTVHTGEKPFTCTTCGKGFTRNSSLADHIRNIHTGERPLPCEVCRKRFSFTSQLKKHQRIHTGEKPYMCTACGKAFSHNCNLKVHIRRVHTGERPYLCKICGKSFCATSNLKNHMKIHTSQSLSTQNLSHNTAPVVRGQKRRFHRSEEPQFGEKFCSDRILEKKHVRINIRTPVETYSQDVDDEMQIL